MATRRKALQQLLSNPIGALPPVVTKIDTINDFDVSKYVTSVGRVVQSADFEPGVNRLSSLNVDLIDPTGFMGREKFFSLVESKSSWGTELSISMDFPTLDGSLGIFRGLITNIIPDEAKASARIEADDILSKIFDGALAQKQPEEEIVIGVTNEGSATIKSVTKFPFTTTDNGFIVTFTDPKAFTVAASEGTFTVGSRIASTYANTVQWFPGERARYLRELTGDPPVVGDLAFNVQPGVSARRMKVDEADNTKLREANLEEGKHYVVHLGIGFIERLVSIDSEEIWGINFTVGGDTYTSDGEEVQFDLTEVDGFFKTDDVFNFETKRIAWFGRQRTRTNVVISAGDANIGVYEPRKFEAGDFAFIGDETVTVNSIGSTFINVTRGTFPKNYEKDTEVKNLTQSIEAARDILIDDTLGLLTNTGYGFGYSADTLDTSQWELFDERTEHIKFEGFFESSPGPEGINAILEPLQASLRITPSGLLSPNIHFPPAPPLDFVEFELKRDFQKIRQKEDPDRFFNTLTINYGGDDLKSSVTEDQTASIALYGRREGEEAKEFQVVQENQNEEMKNTAQRMLNVNQEPLRILTLNGLLSGLLVEPGEYFWTHDDNLGRQGVRLRQRSFSPGKREVQLIADNDHILDVPWCWIGTGNHSLHLNEDLDDSETVIDVLPDWWGYTLHEDVWDTMVGEVLEVESELLRVDSIDVSNAQITVTRAQSQTTAAVHSAVQAETNFSMLQTLTAYGEELRLDNWTSLAVNDVIKTDIENMLVSGINPTTGQIFVNRRYRGTVDGSPEHLQNIAQSADTSIKVLDSDIFSVGQICTVTNGVTSEDMRVEAINGGTDVMEVTRGWHFTPIQQWSSGTSVFVSRMNFSSGQSVVRVRPMGIKTQAANWDDASVRDKDFVYIGDENQLEPKYFFF